MRKLLLILLCVPMMFSCVENNNTENTQNNVVLDDIPEKEDRNSLLWKIEKDDEISYLFGTTHIMCEDQMKYTDLLDALVQEVDVIVYESDDNEMMGQDPMPYGKGVFGIDIPESYKMKNIFSNADIDYYKDYWNSINIDGSVVDILINTDVISAAFIEASFMMYNVDCETTGSEIYLEEINDGKDEFFLENIPEIKNVFTSWINYTYDNIDFSIYDVESAIQFNIETYSDVALLNDMNNYNNNDPQADYDDMMSMADPSDPNFETYKVLFEGLDGFLIQERNEMWMPRIINIMNDDKALFAVGALHVLDLVERLEKEGYTLTPLDIK